MNNITSTPGIRYIDAHCHIDLYPDPASIMREAADEQVGVLAVTNTPSVFEPMLRLAAGFTNVTVALGLHPELAAQREAELRLIPGLLGKTRFVGEVGMDGVTKDPISVASQRRVFRAILDHAQASGPKILTVHTRRAVAESFDILADAPGAVILHWFTGTAAQAEKAAARAWWFSVNLAMLHTSKGLSLIASLPRELVLTETDGPFAMTQSRPSRPADVRQVVDRIASIWKVEHEVARDQIMENFGRCFSIGEKAR